MHLPLGGGLSRIVVSAASRVKRPQSSHLLHIVSEYLTSKITKNPRLRQECRYPAIARLLTEWIFDRGDNLGPDGESARILHFDDDCIGS